ncbi:MAG: hypothetical protein IPK94_08225 [Saprospiraceae bacterium]|nr:hypothetical protein [Saprospiraceae bacterium]
MKKCKRSNLFIVSNSSYYFKEYGKQNDLDLQAISSISFDDLKAAHIKDYQSLYSRLDLQLTNDDSEAIQTDQRIEKVKMALSIRG